MTPPRFFFFFHSFSFLFFGLLIARASPVSILVNDSPLCFAASLMVSARSTVVSFALGPSFPCIMYVMGTYTPFLRSRHVGDVFFFPSSRLDVHVLDDCCSSAVFVRRRLFHSFLGVLTPSNLERARINFGSYCLKSVPLSVKSALSSGNPSL